MRRRGKIPIWCVNFPMLQLLSLAPAPGDGELSRELDSEVDELER